MDIGSIDHGTGKPRQVDSRMQTVAEPTSEPVEVKRTDSVQISDEARSRLAELADAARRVELEHPELTDAEEDKLEHIRARIADGLYEHAEVKRQIADRLAQRLFEQGSPQTEE